MVVTFGTNGNDSIVGTIAADEVHGLDGADTIIGNAGNDNLFGYAGDDSILGGAGDDFIIGAAGNDFINGGTGDDGINASSGDDTVFGGAGDDVITGIWGITDGNDLFYGEAGNDIIAGQYGDDTIDGGLGNDFLSAGAGNDNVTGGAGDDTITSESGNVLLDGGIGNDFINKTAGNGNLIGGAGDDTILSIFGDSTIDGGTGADTYKFSAKSQSGFALGRSEITDAENDGAIEFFTGVTYDINGNFVINYSVLSGVARLTSEPGKYLLVKDHVYYTMSQINGGADLQIAINNMDDVSTEALVIKNFDFVNGAFGITLDDGVTTTPTPTPTPAPIATIIGTIGDDLIQGTAGNDVIDGLAGNDSLIGHAGDDVFISGAGNDFFRGDAGNDTYIYNIGDGNDTISDNSTDINVLKFGAGITQSDVRFHLNVGSPGNTLSVLFKDSPTDSILISGNHLAGDGHISTIEFDDGTIIDWRAGLVFEGTAGNDFTHGLFGDDTITGGAGDDSLFGNAGNDVLIDGAGNDFMKGSAGNDIFVVGQEAGNDTIATFDVAEDKLDVSVTGATTMANLNLTQVGWDVVLTVSAGNTYTISGINLASLTDANFNFTPTTYLPTPTGTGGGTTPVIPMPVATVTGTVGGDVLIGTNGNDVIDGLAGDDQLSGGAGDDTYLYSIGDGNDIITESSAVNNIIRFGAGISQEDIRIYAGQEATGDDGKITITFKNSLTDSIIIENQFGLARTGAATRADTGKINELHFSDGTIIDFSNGLLLEGTAGNDNLFGVRYDNVIKGGSGDDTINSYLGNDTIEGGKGADLLDGENGDDVFVYNIGDGADTITGNGNGIDSIKFGAGISYGDVSIRAGQEATGDDGKITITLKNSPADSIVIENQFGLARTGAATRADTGKINELHFEDGTIVNFSNGLVLEGTTGNDNLFGLRFDNIINGDAGNDTIDGFVGNDTLLGGTGDDVLTGASGSNVFVVEQEDGATDTITDFSVTADKLDVSVTGATTMANLNLTQVGANVVLDLGSANTYVLNNVDLASLTDANFNFTPTTYLPTPTGTGGGTTPPATTPTFTGPLPELGTLLADNMVGGTGSDTILGRDGDDVIHAGAGNDVIFGDRGNDSIYGEAGDDFLEGNAGSDFIDGGLGNDTIEGDSGIGDDTLIGGAGDDNIIGNAGNDIIDGGAGDDTIDGGIGNNTLTGGAGADTFVIAQEVGSQNVITDFDVTQDVLNFSDENFAGLTAANITATQLAADTVLDLGNGQTINLLNTNAATVAASISTFTAGFTASTNTAPTAFNSAAVTDEDTAVTFDILASDTDSAIDYANITLGTTANGTLVNNGDGTATYTPNANYNGADSFTYTVADAEGLVSNVATVSLTVNAVNDDPILAAPISNVYISEGDLFTHTIPADTFTDVDGEVLTYSATFADGSALPEWLTFDAATGTFSGTPDEGYFEVESDERGDHHNNHEDEDDESEVFVNSINQSFSDDDMYVNLKVTATDAAGVEVSQVFTINIVEELENLIIGTAGDDNIVGLYKDENIIVGGAGDDTLTGGKDEDILEGSTGNDVLYGGKDDDTLKGMAGDDILEGGKGKDVFIGGHGADILTGGQGKDDFVYRNILNSDSAGHDIIVDFNTQKDTIVLTELNVAGILDITDLTISNDGVNTFIAANNVDFIIELNGLYTASDIDFDF